MREVVESELQGVLSQDVNRRYIYLLKMVTNEGVLYSLKKDGVSLLMQDESGGELVPLWPAAVFAGRCAVAEWSGAEAYGIKLPSFLDRWVDGLKRDGRRIAIFPTPTNAGAVVEPKRFARDLLVRRGDAEPRVVGEP